MPRINRPFISDVWKYYIVPQKNLFLLVFVGLILNLILSFLFPFLTKAVIDIGVKNKNFSIIYILLIAQGITLFSITVLTVVRSLIFLHIGVSINLSALLKFIRNVVRLPISFFDSQRSGDLLQRFSDNNGVKYLVSAASFNMIFSILNLVIFGTILGYYNYKILLVYFIGSFLYILWVTSFTKKRKRYETQLFVMNASSNNKLLQIINGIKDIKLNNCEEEKIAEWREIQMKLFRLNSKQLVVNQYQQTGATFINIIKNLFITFLTVKLVIQGTMSFGMMISLQYIIGQLNLPLTQFVSFNNSVQDALIGLERMNKILEQKEESHGIKSINMADGSFYLKSIHFAYPNNLDSPILTDVSITIPGGKFTAIIGGSGSGKSTLVKLLLKFYENYDGEIRYENDLLTDIGHREWRQYCSSILQEGYIFSDSIIKNISIGDNEPDISKVKQAAEFANIHEHISTLENGYNTLISETESLSEGQKQRILIARAFYRNPDIIIMDEPTISLDTQNESFIINNLINYFHGKTIILVTHSLKCIEKADQIIVLDGGQIVEVGTHDELIDKKKHYYNLLHAS